jgi:hexosaminidase
MKTQKLVAAAIVALLLFVPQALLFSQAPGNDPGRSAGALLPKPLSVKTSAGVFVLATDVRILVDDSDEAGSLGEYLSREIGKSTGLILPVSRMTSGMPSVKKALVLTTRKARQALGVEGYELSIKPGGIRVSALTHQGLFYGIQTIRQLLPSVPADPDSAEGIASPVSLPCLQIEDSPRFSWRGLNLDCGRHFVSKDFVKRTIDLLARHKMNRLHWHLTEDQGWRIEIKKYPDLTRTGAWRKTEDGIIYGGFYTQEDIADVLAYARSRYVMVVPEIEMPGHSTAALAAYPELSCTGGPFAVQNYWGIHGDVFCAGSERTFEFIQDVLSEVVDLFPAPYVHIGGDECPKDRWKSCPKCQARITSEGLRDERELQSYFIKRIEGFLVSRNRRIVGWDEILEGGLAPRATVQSWRGFEGAVAAARSGHDTIVSPTAYTYLDYDLDTTDLRKVYSFEPVPAKLSAADRHHILGGEGNMWTENAPQETLDSKLFPRLLAIAERLWSPSAARNFEDFEHRSWAQSDRLRMAGVQVGEECHPLTLVPALDAAAKRLTLSLRSEEEGLSLRLTTDGSEPTLASPRYDSPVVILNSCQARARAFKENRPYGEPAVLNLAIHQGFLRPVQVRNRYNPRRSGGGDLGLTDGIRAGAEMEDASWQGYEGADFEAVVDLGEVKPIRKIVCGFLQESSHAVFLPPSVDFSVSNDGANFQAVGASANDVARDNPDKIAKDFGVPVEAASGRFIKVKARNVGTCPAGHPLAGQKAWLFVDEIIVE